MQNSNNVSNVSSLTQHFSEVDKVYLLLPPSLSLSLDGEFFRLHFRSLYGAQKMLYMLVIKGIFTLSVICHGSAKVNHSSMRGLHHHRSPELRRRSAAHRRKRRLRHLPRLLQRPRLLHQKKGWPARAARIWFDEVVGDLLQERDNGISSGRSGARCCHSCSRTAAAAAMEKFFVHFHGPKDTLARTSWHDDILTSVR